MFRPEFLEKYGILVSWMTSSALILLRYVVFAGLAFFIFYKFRTTRFMSIKIQHRFPTLKQLKNEIINSLISVFVFGIFIILIVLLRTNGYTLVYTDVTKYGYLYLLFSLIAIILLHDTYFYWMHRLMHAPKLFKQVHYVHHQSHNPTPWAAFSFHPGEAILEFGILPVAVFVLPLHPVVLFAWSLWMISWNVLGHLGFELFPKRFSRSIWFNWINSSTHHNLHHSHSKGNYGLYFNFWDRLMKTNDKNYKTTFERVFENK